MSISRRNLLGISAAGIVAAAIDVGGSRADAGGLRAGVGAVPGTIRGQVATSPTSVALGTTSWDQTVQRTSYTAPGYQTLVVGPGEPHIVRTDLWADRNPPRGARRVRADDRPAHRRRPVAGAHGVHGQVRGADPAFSYYPSSSAYRPHEYLSTQIVDAMCLAIVAGQGAVDRRPLKFTIVTGDADRQLPAQREPLVHRLAGRRPDHRPGLRADQSRPEHLQRQLSAWTTDNVYYSRSSARSPPTSTAGTRRPGVPFIPGLLKVSTGASAARGARTCPTAWACPGTPPTATTTGCGRAISRSTATSSTPNALHRRLERRSGRRATTLIRWTLFRSRRHGRVRAMHGLFSGAGRHRRQPRLLTRMRVHRGPLRHPRDPRRATASERRRRPRLLRDPVPDNELVRLHHPGLHEHQHRRLGQGDADGSIGDRADRLAGGPVKSTADSSTRSTATARSVHPRGQGQDGRPVLSPHSGHHGQPRRRALFGSGPGTATAGTRSRRCCIASRT